MNMGKSRPPETAPIGLTTAEAAEAQRVFGKNALASTGKNHLLHSLGEIVTEPMFVLLAAAFLLYLFLGDLTESLMMLVSIAFVAGIEVYQETRSEKALDALRAFSAARVRAMRDGLWVEIEAEEVVPGDLLGLGEGDRVAADGEVLQQNDLSVAEAALTGESLPVFKKQKGGGGDDDESLLFHGTTVASGQGLMRVTATGNRTKLGRLGLSIEEIKPAPTPLQLQIARFVRSMAFIGAAAFLVVLGLNLWLEHDFWKALLFSLTVAMALIPEEIPVAFSSFMALGAMRMMHRGILAKQPKTVEALGSATVICLDKTGTITENRMSLAETVSFLGAEVIGGAANNGRNGGHLADPVLENALWASEPSPIDAMEKALLEQAPDFRKDFFLAHEYPLGGSPPMMTHIWQERATGRLVVACKGAVERVLRACGADDDFEKEVHRMAEEKAALGYRVLGVARAAWPVLASSPTTSAGVVGEDANTGRRFPLSQDDFDWEFVGLTAFYDPPKANAPEVFEQFRRAGIRAAMITGDHPATARNIARSTGLEGWELAMTGAQVMSLDDRALRDAVGRVNVFARMFPEAKLRVVEALMANGETVAMTGDGVNDGPALRAAQIGVAMGKSGADIAKTAAPLVLLSDDLAGLATAVAMGRRIYANLRKAIRYVIAIHLPILMAVLVPLAFGWQWPHILLPLHVIFLELVMDPVAAIAFENEPPEPNLMDKPPRSAAAPLFSGKELAFSLLQGAAIAAAALWSQWSTTGRGLPEDAVRASVFTVLVLSNLLLVLASRSMKYTVFRTIFYKNRAIPAILGASLVMLGAVLYVPFLAGLFRVAPLSVEEIGRCALAAFCGVAWFEVWKWAKVFRAA